MNAKNTSRCLDESSPEASPADCGRDAFLAGDCARSIQSCQSFACSPIVRVVSWVNAGDRAVHARNRRQNAGASAPSPNNGWSGMLADVADDSWDMYRRRIKTGCIAMAFDYALRHCNDRIRNSSARLLHCTNHLSTNTHYWFEERTQACISSRSRGSMS